MMGFKELIVRKIPESVRRFRKQWWDLKEDETVKSLDEKLVLENNDGI